MRLPVKLAQVVIAAGIYNVWLVRPNRATPFRGRGAKDLRAEFAAYGLPPWVMSTVGAFKLGSATLLLLGLRYPALTRPAALGMAALMAGAVSMHVKVKDPLERAVPALTMLALSALVAKYGAPERERGLPRTARSERIRA